MPHVKVLAKVVRASRMCSRGLTSHGQGLVLGGGDQGSLDPVDVSGQLGGVGVGVVRLQPESLLAGQHTGVDDPFVRRLGVVVGTGVATGVCGALPVGCLVGRNLLRVPA